MKRTYLKEFYVRCRCQAGIQMMKALGLRLLGEILARQQPVQAEQYFQESLALLEKLGERFEVAWILRSLANLLCDRGEVERAITLHQQAVSIFEEIGAERECKITQEKL
ncbi:MAG TPA: tetratricopeptide repeat protein [Anaerolineaceae bacterium]